MSFSYSDPILSSAGHWVIAVEDPVDQHLPHDRALVTLRSMALGFQFGEPPRDERAHVGAAYG